MQRLRHGAVAQRLDGLDHPGDTRGGLGVPDVGLDRPEVHGPLAVLAVDGDDGACFDGVAQRGSGAVRLDEVHIGWFETGVGQRLADDALLGSPVRCGQATAGAVGVDRAAAQHGEHPVPVALGVGELLQQQDPDALTEAGAVGVVGERLAPSVAGQPSGSRELHETARVGHDGDAAREREPALVLAQRRGGEVQGDQRRRARRVHGQRRPLQPHRIRDAAGHDRRGAAGADVPGDVVGRTLQADRVVVVHHSGEHAGAGSAQRPRVDARALDRGPGVLQQQPLLRVHRQRLTRGDAEEARVEQARVGQEATLLDGERTGSVGVPKGVLGPAAVGREAADAVAALGNEPPQVLR